MMAKISRKMLKGLVKECLVEILQEGIGNIGSDISPMMTERCLDPSRTRRNRIQKQDEKILATTTEATQNKRISALAKNITSDPMMRSLFEDTARTTFSSQDETSLKADSGVSLDSLNNIGINVSSWESMAFKNLPNSDRLKLEQDHTYSGKDSKT